MQADYVIVGAGSAGCVLANRLTEDPATRVVLIEAGGRDWNPLIHIPAGFMKLLDHPTLTWGFKAEADPGTNGRAIPYPRGRVLGGSSSINGPRTLIIGRSSAIAAGAGRMCCPISRTPRTGRARQARRTAREDF
jgi:choline dehydrogenase-like flavoprotein